MTWLRRLVAWAWWKGSGMGAPSPRRRPWPRGRVPGPPRFAPQRAERLPDDADLLERIERLDWRYRELAKERALEREQYGRERSR